MLNHEINRAFKQRILGGGPVLMPGAANALAARIIEEQGFEAIYLSGAGLTNTYLGMPDMGFIGLSEIAQHTSTIRDATELPIVVDADNGFGNALNVRHAIRTLERAGASAVQLEDQKIPKRCGHFSGKEVVPLAEARSRIRAAVDARQDANTMIVARTDARATDGFTEALDRAVAFVEDGADITFVEAPQSVEEMERMVSGYLDFARGEEGERIEEVDLGRMLDDLARISAGRPGAGHGAARSIAVSHDPDLLLPLRAGAMRRCLENLVQNALRHGNRVAITARRNDAAIDISIDDDGPGIPEAQREAVFRPFFRLDRARNPDTGGVGLGLTIARDVVRSHGGEIHLETAPQGGLRVAIRLPV